MKQLDAIKLVGTDNISVVEQDLEKVKLKKAKQDSIIELKNEPYYKHITLGQEYTIQDAKKFIEWYKT